MQVGLAVQVRLEVAVDPGAVRVRSHLDRAAGRRGEPPHQLGLHVTVDLALVDLHACEPAVVLFEAEQGAGVVEEHRAHLHG